MFPTRIVVFVLTATVLAISGCGGSSGPSKPLTQAELVAKADAICSRVFADRAAMTSKIKTQQDMASQAPPFAAYEQEAFTQLGKLVPPVHLASSWKQLVSAAQMLAADTDRLGEYAKNNQFKAAYAQAFAMHKDEKQLAAVATPNGFVACSRFS